MKYSKLFLIIVIIIFTGYFCEIVYFSWSSVKEGLAVNGSQAFCDSHSGHNLETACNGLTKYNCGLTSCCVWTADNKCKAGNVSGPIFHSDVKGKSLPLHYYYFQNKCYGEKCP